MDHRLPINTSASHRLALIAEAEAAGYDSYVAWCRDQLRIAVGWDPIGPNQKTAGRRKY